MRANPLGPIGGLGLSLDEVAKHATDAHIVEQIEGRRLGLLDGFHRKPDDRVRRRGAAGRLHRHVVLPHMRAVGGGRERDVDASLISSGR